MLHIDTAHTAHGSKAAPASRYSADKRMGGVGCAQYLMFKLPSQPQKKEKWNVLLQFAQSNDSSYNVLTGVVYG
jgi:hypothetical protein